MYDADGIDLVCNTGKCPIRAELNPGFRFMVGLPERRRKFTVVYLPEGTVGVGGK